MNLRTLQGLNCYSSLEIAILFGRRRVRSTTHGPMVSGRKNPLFFGLASRLKLARRKAGLKRLPLAQRAGLATATARDVELGTRLPTVATVARIAVALGVSASWLAYGIGETGSENLSQSTDGLGARLAALRAERGLSRAELARRCEVSPRAITKIEAGGQSGVEVIESLAKELGVSPGWLAFGVGPQVVTAPRRGRPPAQTSASVS